MKVVRYSVLIIMGLTALIKPSFGQITTDELSGKINTVTTAVPFLTIAPDSRSLGMGWVGAALSPDANSMHWNPAKYAFAPNDMGLSISYVPWLRKLIPDINVAYLSGYKRIDKQQVIGMSLRYFSLGNITFTDVVGNTTQQFNPNEFSVDAAYARSFSKNFGASLAFRFVYSNLTGGYYVGGIESHPGMAFASDVSVYYQNTELRLKDYDATIAFGANISNIGSKISYTQNSDKDFIPINLRLGTAFTIEFDDYNSLTAAVDLNKLLVPTPPSYYKDSVDIHNDPVIEAGFDPNVPVAVGMLHSFYDAPGGFAEELKEITYSVGIEYWYAKQFAIRSGFFYEDGTKGNRKFFTVGIGLRLNVFGLDFSYLVPVNNQNSPLANTLSFSLLFNFAGLNNKK
ncbi:MAG: type IX secretion system outer membrane channel protein PorV [Bacteroidales bacterium]